MTTTKTFQIGDGTSSYKKGQFLVWSMFLQTSATWTVTLADNAFTYLNNVSGSGVNYVKLAQGSATIQGTTGLTLTLTTNTSMLKSNVNAAEITDDAGNVKGWTWTLLGEDYTDDDYNDLLCQITCWKSYG